MRDASHRRTKLTIKPRSQTIHSARQPESLECRGPGRFPITDCNYQSVTLAGCNGHPNFTSSPSFLNISRDYLQNEARWTFVAEVVCFAVIIAITAVPVVNAAHVLVQFVRSFAAA